MLVLMLCKLILGLSTTCPSYYFYLHPKINKKHPKLRHSIFVYLADIFQRKSFYLFRALIAGGGAPETEASVKLMNYAKALTGKEAYCFKEFAQALEIIPYTLAENAGLSPIGVVTELRNKHAQGEKNFGINVRKVSRVSILFPFFSLRL